MKSESEKKEKNFESFSISEDFKYLKITDMQHLGIPENVTKSLTYDRIQGLLAVGSMEGSIKIFGKEGIEVMLLGLDTNPIEQLEFLTNKGMLISYSSISKYLTLWSLIDLSAIPIPISFRYFLISLTKIYYPSGPYVYLSTEQGTLRVFNIAEKRITAFELRPSSLGISQDPLIDISFHPIITEKIMLAYENQGIYIWNFKSNKISEKIICSGIIHCCRWSPDGNSIAVGLRDGCILLWKLEKNPQIYKNFRPDSDARDLNVTAIDTIYWLASCMVVSGGMPFNSPNQISVISGAEFNDITHLSMPVSVSPLQILSTPSEENENAFLLLSQSGALLTFTIPLTEMAYINDLYGGSEVLCSKFYTISNEGEGLIQLIQWLSPANKSRVLKGGEVIENTSDIYGLFVTGHSAGMIRFWSVSSVRIYNISNLSIISKEQGTFYQNTVYQPITELESSKISCVEVLANKVIVGYDLGKVAIWEIAPQQLNLINVHDYHVSPVLKASLAENFIVTGDIEGNILVYNIENSSALITDVQELSAKKGKKKPKQAVSVTNIQYISSTVYIGLSNGGIFEFKPLNSEFVQVKNLQKTDFKSEVPKKSEFGVLQLLHTCVDPSLVIVCYEKSASLSFLSDFAVKESQFWSVPMISASIAHIRSEVYIYMLHIDGVISMLEFFTLKRVWKSHIPIPVHTCFKDFHISLDGHFITTTSSKQLIAGWITLQDDELNLQKPCLYKIVQETEKKPEKKTKSFLGIKFSSEVNLSNLCNCYAVEKPSDKFAADDEEEFKDESQITASVSQAKSGIEQALQKVNERGDKIKTLDVKIREMTEKSKIFSDMAAELARKEKNKKWWQL